MVLLVTPLQPKIMPLKSITLQKLEEMEVGSDMAPATCV
jgi:hypothetical protein